MDQCHRVEIQLQLINAVSHVTEKFRWVIMLSKGFWVFAPRRYSVVRNQRFGTTCLSQLQVLAVIQKKEWITSRP
jgi:hypothetical protein